MCYFHNFGLPLNSEFKLFGSGIHYEASKAKRKLYFKSLFIPNAIKAVNDNISVDLPIIQNDVFPLLLAAKMFCI